MTTAIETSAETYKAESADLACQMGGSDKVYRIQLSQSEAGWAVHAQYGPRNGTLTPQTKIEGACYEKAKKAFDKLIAEKLKGKGDGTHYSYVDGAPQVSAPSGYIAPARTNSRGPISPDVVFSPELLTRITEAEAQRFASDSRYLFQTKQDGDRLTIRVHGESIHGYNKLGQVVRLDAELHAAIFKLVEPNGITSLLMDGEWEPTGFYAWDLLECKFDLRQQPYQTRLDMLETFLGDLTPELAAILHVTYTARTSEEKRALLANRKLEGICAKDRIALFRPGRNGQHKKFKFEQTASFVVGEKRGPKANDGKRSVALYIFDEASQGMRFVATVKVADRYDVPALGSIVEIRYLYAYKGTGGIAQPCYFGKVRSDLRIEECSTAQLKYKAAPDDDDDAV